MAPPFMAANAQAGADSVYAFMLGSPSFFTRADVARGFRGAVGMQIERLIELADSIDGDADDEPSLASLERHPNGGGWGVGATPSGLQPERDVGGSYDGEEDAGEEREEDPAEAGIADEDAYALERFGEPSLGWAEGREDQSNPSHGSYQDGEQDAGEEVERCYHEGGSEAFRRVRLTSSGFVVSLAALSDGKLMLFGSRRAGEARP